MPFDTVEHNKKRNLRKMHKYTEGYERTDGFTHPAGRLYPDKTR